MIFQQPNFFGCLEPAPDIAAAANEAGAVSVAHVDLMTLGMLEAPGEYGCQLAIGEGQSAGNHCPTAVRTTDSSPPRWSTCGGCQGGSWARPTTSVGSRGYVLTLQTREQHIRREKATSNITTNQTLLALVGSCTCPGWGRRGSRDVGQACLSLVGVRQGDHRPGAGVRPSDSQGVRGPTNRPASEVVAAARKLGVHPGYALGREYPGMDDVLLVAVTEQRTRADIDRLAQVLAEVAA